VDLTACSGDFLGLANARLAEAIRRRDDPAARQASWFCSSLGSWQGMPFSAMRTVGHRSPSATRAKSAVARGPCGHELEVAQESFSNRDGMVSRDKAR
jgi:hypothetical protein